MTWTNPPTTLASWFIASTSLVSPSPSPDDGNVNDDNDNDNNDDGDSVKDAGDQDYDDHEHNYEFKHDYDDDGEECHVIDYEKMRNGGGTIVQLAIIVSHKLLGGRKLLPLFQPHILQQTYIYK